jgi:hypothetical protein
MFNGNIHNIFYVTAHGCLGNLVLSRVTVVSDAMANSISRSVSRLPLYLRARSGNAADSVGRRHHQSSLACSYLPCLVGAGVTGADANEDL